MKTNEQNTICGAAVQQRHGQTWTDINDLTPVTTKYMFVNAGTGGGFTFPLDDRPMSEQSNLPRFTAQTFPDRETVELALQTAADAPPNSRFHLDEHRWEPIPAGEYSAGCGPTIVVREAF